MRIGIVVEAEHLSHWQVRLRDRLAAGGLHDTTLVTLSDATGLPAPRDRALSGLLALERALSKSGAWLSDRLSPREVPIAAWDSAAFDAVVDARAKPDFTSCHRDSVRWLTPTFDDTPGEAAMWHALLDGRAPLLAVHDARSGQSSILALTALEMPHHILDSAEAVLTHLIAALARTVEALAARRPLHKFATTPAPRAAASAHHSIGRGALRSLAGLIAIKAACKRDSLLQRAPVWQVAYRHAPDRTHPPARFEGNSYIRLADDGQRYFADPFVVARDGQHHVFIEELPYATGRGVISYFTINRDGRVSPPRPLIEEPHHLSYPQVFELSGNFWMLPEASASGRLDLYRCERFPDVWVRHACLIDAPLHDATLFEHEGRLWIAAGLQLDRASSWDTLALYSAASLYGPWSPHPLNPVLVDARAARPAGALYCRDGALWRPAQDCRQGYGAALTLNRITSLNSDCFSQDLVATLELKAGLPSCGPHTINFAGGLEVIDLFAPRGPAAAPRSIPATT